MKNLEAHDPFLAAEILRNVLRVSSMARMRLEREVSALETSTLKSGKNASIGFGQSILAQISGTKIPGVDQQEHRRSHQFQHITVDGLPHSDAGLEEGKIEVPNHQPHLSRPMKNDVMDCFIHHSAPADKQVKHNKRELGRSQFFSSASNREFHDPFDTEHNAAGRSAVNSFFTKAGERRIKIKQLQKAVMDLGFFPTLDEINL